LDLGSLEGVSLLEGECLTPPSMGLTPLSKTVTLTSNRGQRHRFNNVDLFGLDRFGRFFVSVAADFVFQNKGFCSKYIGSGVEIISN
jgi:hypothetical protein